MVEAALAMGAILVQMDAVDTVVVVARFGRRSLASVAVLGHEPRDSMVWGFP